MNRFHLPGAVGIGGKLALLILLVSSNAAGGIRGVVRSAGGPIEGAVVRLRGTTLAVSTDAEGVFEIPVPEGPGPVTITASARGHFIGGVEAVAADATAVTIFLRRYPGADDPEYEFLAASNDGDIVKGCEGCHSGNGKEALPYDQWRTDAHSRSAVNHRFLTMYTGRDVLGNQSPTTRRGRTRDYGSFPLRPDRARPYFGPGYLLDFPETAGNCAACHVPVLAAASPYEASPTDAAGTALEGVTCDFCHKVVDVELDPSTGLPRDSRPGVMSLVLRRPAGGHQLFAGPYDDVFPGDDIHSPLYRESRYCAPCHFAAFWGTVIYGSFSEWLESPYADVADPRAQTCQSCHMPTGGADHVARMDRGGLRRNPDTVATHAMPGADDAEILRGAATMRLEVRRANDALELEVAVTNSGTGHHLPTDSPLRQVLLVVEATGSGRRLALEEGPTLPPWAGELAGRPGRAFAKVLEDRWTEESPTAAYWRPTRIADDTRIPALATSVTRYRFATVGAGPVLVTVTLLYRRAFAELAAVKGWNDSDILMARSSVLVP